MYIWYIYIYIYLVLFIYIVYTYIYMVYIYIHICMVQKYVYIYIYIYMVCVYIYVVYICCLYINRYGILPIICKLLFTYMKTKTDIYIYKCCSIMFFHVLPITYLIIEIFWRGILHEINRPGAWESERYTDLESSPQRLGGASIDGFPLAPGGGMSC